MIDSLPPLSLYIHIPWCVRKCPYCDFNSHQVREALDEPPYIDALLADLEQDLKQTGGRPLHSIFIGGGTPSLFSPGSIAALLAGVMARVETEPELEITLEANPGTLEADNFSGYRDAGVNRLSVGVQSFDTARLQALGRIHDPDQAMLAVERARQAGFSRINLDLMFGLPGQTSASAAEDLSIALKLDPGHISYYQLTLEPNTHFHQFPPALPDDELIWEIHSQGQTRLAEAGYLQYEISAYARPGERCRHNLNYWCFGDYIGIGAGAHGKLTLADGRILRNWKQRRPQAYLAAAYGAGAVQGERWLERDDRLLEFMMNALRLNEGFSLSQFEARSGLSRRQLDEALATAQARELLLRSGEQIRPSLRGHAFLNDLLAIFTPR